jgi:hypothetical protein
MTRWFLSILFFLGGSLVFSIEPHPDATPSTHAPGEVDIKANLKFIIPNPDTLPGIVLDETSSIL